MPPGIVSTTEYDAVRTGAGLLDKSDRGKIAFSGRDRASYLQGLLTNDILALTRGRGCYAAYLTPQGRMIADMRLIETGDEIVMDVDGHLKEMLLNRFDQFIFTEQVKLRDQTKAWGELSIHGPASARVLSSALALSGLTSEDPRRALDALEEHANVTCRGDERFAIVVAAGGTGEKGFDVYTPRGDQAALRDALLRSGAIEIGEETADVLRIEAGVPRFGVDMDEETSPLEAGIEDRAISVTKGCYVGQEVIIRVLHRGQGRVAKKLVGLVLEGSGVTLPAHGDEVRSGDRIAGRVTSAAHSPRIGRPIALAYVYRDFMRPGTALSIVHGDEVRSAAVTKLPFGVMSHELAP
jgi:folate-binding protein YgfZ